MTDDALVLRCPRHPTYTGDGAPPPMASHTQHCAACARLREITSLLQRAARTDNWLVRQMLLSKAEVESWPRWKKKLVDAGMDAA